MLIIDTHAFTYIQREHSFVPYCDKDGDVAQALKRLHDMHASTISSRSQNRLIHRFQNPADWLRGNMTRVQGAGSYTAMTPSRSNLNKLGFSATWVENITLKTVVSPSNALNDLQLKANNNPSCESQPECPCIEICWNRSLTKIGVNREKLPKRAQWMPWEHYPPFWAWFGWFLCTHRSWHHTFLGPQQTMSALTACHKETLRLAFSGGVNLPWQGWSCGQRISSWRWPEREWFWSFHGEEFRLWGPWAEPASGLEVCWA